MEPHDLHEMVVAALFPDCFDLIFSSRFLATLSALLSSHAEIPLDFRWIVGFFSDSDEFCSPLVSADTSTPDTRMSPGSSSPISALVTPH